MIRKFFKTGPSLSDEEIDRTAVHEAGHAVGYVIYGFDLWRVEIFPKGRGNRLGRCSPSRWGGVYISASQWREYARIGCAGYIAERLLYGTADEEFSEQDFEDVKRLLAKYGERITIGTIRGETIHLLKQYTAAIRSVADELLICRRVTGRRVKEIVHERSGAKGADIHFSTSSRKIERGSIGKD